MKQRVTLRLLLWAFLTASAVHPQIFGSKSLSQLIPFGLDAKAVTSVAIEYPEKGNQYSRYLPLIAGTAGDGVYKILPFDSLPNWSPIGLEGKTVTALTIQHWGVGPADGERAFAAVAPDTANGDTTSLYQREIYWAIDSMWTPADSDLPRQAMNRIRALSSYYYTGHAPPQPVLLGRDTGLYYGEKVWYQSSYDGPVRVNAIDVAPHWFGDLAWAAGQRGLSPVALRSTDQGKNWTTFFLPSFLEGEAFSVSINPASRDTVYVGGRGVLWITADSGATWSSSSLQPVGVTITALAVDPVWPWIVYAGGARENNAFACYISKDAGFTWQEVLPPDTQHVAGVSSIAVAHLSDIGDFEESYAFIGTLGSGVWRLASSGVTGFEEPPNIPDRFELYQNYPNPFNPKTVIGYHLPAGQAGLSVTSLVSIEVYDVLGRKVATLLNEKKEPGRHKVLWDASGFASGVYFYRLSVGNFITTRKLLLTR